MGSLSWDQITQLYWSLTHQVDVLEEGLQEAQQLVDHLQNVGVGVASTFSILVLLTIIWSYKNWGLIRKIFSKIKKTLPTPPTLENIRRMMGDFLKIRGMNLPEE